ncbi:MAG: hypothetical protein HOE32_06945 [Nitrospina sp.]|jgi:hypothetical protein|nr:hypothetical protein [Nitrospina sp.]
MNLLTISKQNMDELYNNVCDLEDFATGLNKELDKIIYALANRVDEIYDESDEIGYRSIIE